MNLKNNIFNHALKQRRQQQELQELKGEEYPDESYNDESYDDFDGFDDEFTHESDNSRWELDSKNELDDYFHYLLGEKYDSEKNRWVELNDIKPKMNKLGAYEFITRLKAVMHKGTYLANIDEEYAKAQTKAETYAYMSELHANLKHWGVDKSSIRVIILDYARNVYMALTRPVKDMERKHRNKRMRMNYNEQNNNKEDKPKIQYL